MSKFLETCSSLEIRVHMRVRREMLPYMGLAITLRGVTFYSTLTKSTSNITHANTHRTFLLSASCLFDYSANMSTLKIQAVRYSEIVVIVTILHGLTSKKIACFTVTPSRT